MQEGWRVAGERRREGGVGGWPPPQRHPRTSNLQRSPAGSRIEDRVVPGSCSKPGSSVEPLKGKGRSKGEICKLDFLSILLNHQKLLENSIRVLTPQTLENPAWKVRGGPAPSSRHWGRREGQPEAPYLGILGLVFGLSRLAWAEPVAPPQTGVWASQKCAVSRLELFPL